MFRQDEEISGISDISVKDLHLVRILFKIYVSVGKAEMRNVL